MLDYFEDVERAVVYWRKKVLRDFSNDELHDLFTRIVCLNLTLREYRVFIRLMACRTYEQVVDYLTKVENKPVTLAAVEKRGVRARDKFFEYVISAGK